MLLSATPPPGPRPHQERRLLDEAVRHRALTPPSRHPEASITWLGPAAAHPALAHRLTGDPAHLAEAERWIAAAVRLPHWGRAHMPDHDLDAGWLLHGLSLAHHWIGDVLSPDLVGLLRYKLLVQGRRLYEFAVATEGRWWSSSYWQNHNWICYAGLATAGYVLGREEWTERAKDNLGRVLDALPADGSHAEGVVYWRYGVPWLAIHLDLLQECEGLDWWDRGGFMEHTFGFRLHQSAPGFAEQTGHGDCHDRRSGHSVALYRRLAARFGIGEAQWLADLVDRELFDDEAVLSGVRPGIRAEAYLEYLWHDPSVEPVAPARTHAYFPDLGLLTARTGWDAAATFVSFKAAPGGGHQAWETSAKHRADLGWETLGQGHHHPDAGSFVLTSGGSFLAVDEGYSNNKRTAHHNLLLVDGQGFAGEGRYHVYEGMPYEHRARLRDVLADGGWAHGTAEIAAMYPSELGVRRLDRTLVCTPSGRLVLLDEAAADTARTWTFLLQTDAPTTPHGPDGHDRLIEAGDARAWLRRHAPDDGEVVSRPVEVEANPTSSTPELSITRTLHTLRVTTPARAQARFLTTIEPEAQAPTARWTPYGITFATPDGPETVLLSPVERRIEAPGVSAHAAAVLLAPGRAPYVVAGTRLALDGRTVRTWTEPHTGSAV
ncbi:heparinase II/III family protein [Streptomyces sp. VRA16 Mangrove soil]|uniref:heparinase II/III family protein n=1 Tax=Streptomyces sp. VRA16 Mangrove soil TaxID=2817434 RepID=UPI001A9CEAFF|nr:heparinase II/III family protein [Streptomyces sp. VRA16 Mangrove soil]MBO1332970.1 heparinase II/III family protein [Streptomyces sp. VRA16 Mangrove soil]